MTTTPGDLDIDAGMARMLAKINSRTPEEKAAAEKERAEDELRAHRRKVQELVRQANLPKRQALKTDLDITGKWQEKFTAIKAKLGTGFLIALVGNRGNGKTQMAVRLAQETTELLKLAYYMTATSFFMEIKATYRKDSEETEQGVVEEYQKPALLIVDEVGSRAESDWENRLLLELLNRRYADMRDTILIDNRTPAEFSDAVGPSLTSRMNETGGIIHCDWPSYRNA